MLVNLTLFSSALLRRVFIVVTRANVSLHNSTTVSSDIPSDELSGVSVLGKLGEGVLGSDDDCKEVSA